MNPIFDSIFLSRRCKHECFSINIRFWLRCFEKKQYGGHFFYFRKSKSGMWRRFSCTNESLVCMKTFIFRLLMSGTCQIWITITINGYIFFHRKSSCVRKVIFWNILWVKYALSHKSHTNSHTLLTQYIITSIIFMIIIPILLGNLHIFKKVLVSIDKISSVF